MPGAPSPLASLAACAEDLLLEALQQSRLEQVLEAQAVAPVLPAACGEGLLNGGAMPRGGAVQQGWCRPVKPVQLSPCRPQAQSCLPGNWNFHGLWRPPGPGHSPRPR